MIGKIILAFTLQMSSLHREGFGQVVEEPRSMGAKEATGFGGIVPFTHDAQAQPQTPPPRQPHAGIHPMSGDPQSPARPPPELTISEPSTPTTTKEPRRSSRLKSSLQKIFESPRAKPSRSTRR